jgi:hypothetical protein
VSYQATTWVMEFSESRLADRLVLGAIAHRVSNDNGEAFPSVETIAREANVSESSVHASLKKLKRLGELEIDVAASQYGTNVYQMPKFKAWMEALHLPRSGSKGGAKSVPHRKGLGSNLPSSGVQNSEARDTGFAPEPSRTIIREPEAEVSPAAAHSAFLDLGFKELFGHPRFQAIWTEEWERIDVGNGVAAVDAMERTARQCAAENIPVPPLFFEVKRKVERQAVEQRFQRVVL